MHGLLRHLQKLKPLWRSGPAVILLAAFSLLFLSSFAYPGAAQADFSPYINYQGKLADGLGNIAADGNYNMKFRLCQDSACASPVWTESWEGASKVHTASGLFSVMLGSQASLVSVDFNQSLYLEVSIGGTGVPAYETLLPRKILGAVPNSFNSQKLGGLASSSFLRSDIANASGTINNFTALSATSTNLRVLGLSSLATTTVNGKLSTQGMMANSGFDYSTQSMTSQTVSANLGGPVNVNAAIYGYSTSTDFDGTNTTNFFSAGIYGRSNNIGMIGEGSLVGVIGFGNVGGVFNGLGDNAVGIQTASNGDGNVGAILEANGNNAVGVSGLSSGSGSRGGYFQGETGIEVNESPNLGLYIHSSSGNGIRVTTASTTGYAISAQGNSFFQGNISLSSGSSVYAPNVYSSSTSVGTTSAAELVNVGGNVNVSGCYKVNGVCIPTLLAIPAGSNGQVLFNDNGSFGASNNFVWDNANKVLRVGENTSIATGSAVNNSLVFGNTNRLNAMVGSGLMMLGGSNNVSLGGSLIASNNSTSTNGIVIDGNSNQTSGINSVAVAGANNNVSGTNAGSFAGVYNTVSETSAVAIGGNNNNVSGSNGGTFSGHYNTVSAQDAAVLGGLANTASANYSVILGGGYSTSSGNYAAVLSGRSNLASGDYSVILGGSHSVALGESSGVLGGSYNFVSGAHALALDGRYNTVSGDFSYALGGENNVVSSSYSYAFGRHMNIASSSIGSIGFGLDNNTYTIATTGLMPVFAIMGGNLGVGSTSPATKFVVVGTSTVQDVLPSANLTYALGSSAYRFNDVWSKNINIGTSTWSLAARTDGGLAIFDGPQASGNQRLIIATSTGNVTVSKDLNILGVNLIADSLTNIQFGNNGNAGTFTFGDSSKALYFGGTKLFVASTTNNVGIGTTAPSTALEVVGTASSSALRVNGNGTVTGVMNLSGTSGNTLVVDTNTLVVDASNNRVGIGTASPSTALEVVGTASSSALRVNGNGTFTGSLTVSSATGNALVVNSNNLVVDATNGRVGVGTSTPSQKFEIYSGNLKINSGVNGGTATPTLGSIIFDGQYDTDASVSSITPNKIVLGQYPGIALFGTSTFGIGLSNDVSVIGTHIPTSFDLFGGTAANFNFYTNYGSDTAIPRSLMTMQSNGMVGIGTGANKAVYRLDVLDDSVTQDQDLFRVGNTANPYMFTIDKSGAFVMGTSSTAVPQSFSYANNMFLVSNMSDKGSYITTFQNSSTTGGGTTGGFVVAEAEDNAWSIFKYTSFGITGAGTSTSYADALAIGYKFSTSTTRSAITISTTTNVGIGDSVVATAARLQVHKTTSTASDILFAVSTSSNSTNYVFKVMGDGKYYADGVYSGAADYAEYFYTPNADLVSGEAVCIDVANPNAVIRCQRGADPDIMGIVSTKPAVVGNYKAGREKDAHYKIVGMLGQVPAKVSAENGAIRPGDSLTSALLNSGYLMKASAGDSTVGVALENLDAGIGEVNVLISRRNKSLTVEQVEEKVTERLANMKIEDEARIAVNSAINSMTSANSDILTAYGTRIAAVEDEASSTRATIASLQNQVSILTGGLPAANLQGSTSSAAAALSDGSLVVQADLSVKGNLTVNAAATFYGTIMVKGEAGFESKVTFSKDVEVKGKIYVSADQAGTVILAKGSTTAEVKFNEPYSAVPKITLSQNYSVDGLFAKYAIKEKSVGGFKIVIDSPASADLSFDWIAMGTKESAETDITPAPVVQPAENESPLPAEASSTQVASPSQNEAEATTTLTEILAPADPTMVTETPVASSTEEAQ